MNIFKNTILFLILFFNGIVQSQISPTFTNVDYVGNDNMYQKMDIYIPPGLTAPAPVIIYIHGGAWSSGSKGQANSVYFQSSYNAGFICVDINYRLTTNNDRWPKQINDCKAAVKFLKANASTYNIDKCRFGAMGISAGGHLAALLGTTGEVASLENSILGNNSENSRIQAVVDMFGPTDFSLCDGYYFSCTGTPNTHNTNSGMTELFDIDALSNHPTLVQTANPIAYITNDDAKFYIIHGVADCMVPNYQSVILNNALSNAGIPADSFILANGQGHGGPYFYNTLRTNAYRDFFLTHLGTPCNLLDTIDHSFDKKTIIYPNPSKKILNIDNQSNALIDYELIDVSGKIILRDNIKNQIDISSLKNGYYLLKIDINNKIEFHKILKE